MAKHAVAQVIAQAVVDLGRSCLLLPQFIHSCMRKVTFAVQFAVVCQHEPVAENIVCGGEQAASSFRKTVNTITVRLGQKTDVSSGVAILLLVWTISAG